MKGGKNGVYRVLDYVWILVSIIVFFAAIKLINDGTLEAKVASLGLWAPLVIVLLKASTLVFAPLGGVPLYIIAGALYGPATGLVITFVGDTLGSVICFALSRRYGRRVVNFFAGSMNAGKIERVIGVLNGTRSYIKARIAFTSLPELLAYAAGLSKINFWKFFVLHMPFYLPVNFILVFLGSTVVHFTAKYAVLTSIAAIIAASLGIWALSKDYKKLEGM
jgi:uncharacterized membrane protein YdjX (TVP38/TMEM64 family)